MKVTLLNKYSAMVVWLHMATYGYMTVVAVSRVLLYLHLFIILTLHSWLLPIQENFEFSICCSYFYQG